MRVLLLNDNPVVNKLVTLSVEKAGHELIKAESIGAVEAGRYDLLIIEEGLYDTALIDELGSFISFSHSMLIASRDTVVDDLFGKVLHKPFLPTELLLMLHQIAAAVEAEASVSEVIDPGHLGTGPEGKTEAETPVQGGYLRTDFAEEADENAQTVTAQRPGFDEAHIRADEETMPRPVLDEEDVRAVQDLLEDVENAEERDETPAYDDEDILARATELSSMEEEISEALMELSEEELMAPADEELLLDIVGGEGDMPDDEEVFPSFSDTAEFSDRGESVAEEPAVSETEVGIEAGNIEGLEALHALLDVLQNKELAKSLKGNITINISFGEKQ
jgi:uncharacterized membrane protein